MKRILMILTAFLLLFSTTGTPLADAKGATGGARGGGSSFSSKPASSPTKSTNPAKSTKTDKTTKNPEKTAKTDKTTKPAPAPAQPSQEQINSFKHKPAFNTRYVAVPQKDRAKYENKSYYSRDNGGFLSTLATAAGTYLVLDAILDNGDPVYIDSETGERIDADSLEEITADQDAPDDEGSDFLGTVFIIFLALLALGALIFIIRL